MKFTVSDYIRRRNEATCDATAVSEINYMPLILFDTFGFRPGIFRQIKYARISFQATLIFLMDHLALVVSQSARNKMTPQNLAVCFGPILMLHSESREKELDFQEPINVLRYLLEIWPSKSGKVQRESLAHPW